MRLYTCVFLSGIWPMEQTIEQGDHSTEFSDGDLTECYMRKKNRTVERDLQKSPSPALQSIALQKTSHL